MAPGSLRPEMDDVRLGRGASFRLRVGIVALTAPAALVTVLLLPPIPQSQGYHQFADSRVILGIPHFGDVVTNAPYLVVGAAGLWWLARRGRKSPAFTDPREMRAYAVFFLGVTLTAFGSTWYHLAPTNDSLLWDRLPMSLAFMGLFSAVLAERVGLRVGTRLLSVLVAGGLASVLHWHLTERAGAGDLRFYGLVQFYPMLAIPLMMLLLPARYSRSGYLWGVMAWYAAAKAAEVLDRPILEATGVVTGHNLKHVLAALSALWLLLMLYARRPTPPPEDGKAR